jgi:hypothetical protein
VSLPVPNHLQLTLTGKREALDAGLRLARLLLSVAAGTIVLSATLLQTVYVGRSHCLLLVAWGALAISLILGYFAYAEYVNRLEEADPDPKGLFEGLSLLQVITIFVGLVLFAIFVAINLSAGPRLEATRAELLGRARVVAVTVDCRSGSDSGCRGEVMLGPPGKPAGTFGRALFAGEADGPQVARVRLRAGAVALLAKASKPKLEVVARATGRFGNQTRATGVLVLRRPPRPARRAGRPG